tara:strand:- start:3090 stop:3671 length:582 start_codon:yes stop_codon:yes gene_type:complete
MQTYNIFPTVVGSVKLNLDLNSLENYCKNIKLKSKGRVLSNIYGYQSNDLDLKDEKLKEFLTILYATAQDYALNILELKNKLRISNMWFNYNTKKCSNGAHVHPDSVVSGVFYVKTPPHSGDIIFHREDAFVYFARHAFKDKDFKKFNFFNSRYWSITPEENTLLLFPSWLLHSVTENITEKERLSFSFNFKL